jgi:hypothetical protein
MGNDHNQKIITFQGSTIPSMPLVVALVGLQTSYNYCPTSITLIVPLVTLFIVYITS